MESNPQTKPSIDRTQVLKAAASLGVLGSGANGAPRGETSCSLLNQRNAALTFDFWLASVLALAPTVA